MSYVACRVSGVHERRRGWQTASGGTRESDTDSTTCRTGLRGSQTLQSTEGGRGEETAWDRRGEEEKGEGERARGGKEEGRKGGKEEGGRSEEEGQTRSSTCRPCCRWNCRKWQFVLARTCAVSVRQVLLFDCTTCCSPRQFLVQEEQAAVYIC